MVGRGTVLTFKLSPLVVFESYKFYKCKISIALSFQLARHTFDI